MKDSGKFLFLDPADAPKNTADALADETVEIDPCAKAALAELVTILHAGGLDPITQLSGYLITEDPTYLPEGTNARGVSARAIARRVGRDKLLETLIELYIETHHPAPDPKS